MTASAAPMHAQVAPALTAVDLRVEIGGIELTRVSLEVAAGECLAIVGESGSGKTLTARALLGIAPDGARVTSERLLVGGVDTAGFGEARWRDLRGRVAALVSQDALVSLDPLRRVGREVAEPIEVHRPTERDVRRRVIELLDLVAIPEPESRSRQYPHELSGGLRQRALIASALAGEPVLLVADEPTTALDTTVQSQVLALLGQLKQQGLAVLLVSHDLAAVARLADRIAVMHEGRIVEQGLARTVLEEPRHEVTRALLASLPHARRRPATTTGPVVLEAHGLHRRYPLPEGGTRAAVADVSLRLRAGATLGVVGESGSGKSTVARMLLALERPDAGTVLLGGEPWSELPERGRTARRGRIQLIDQDPFSAFDPRWRVGRALAEALALDGVPRRARAGRARELLAMVGLDRGVLDRRPSTLSGGQRQRVAIARALARRPEVLVCDEPVSALDATVQAQVLALLESLQDRFGLAIVIISHDLGVVRQLSDDLLVLRDGKVVEQGPADSVLGAPAHDFTRRLLAAAAQPRP